MKKWIGVACLGVLLAGCQQQQDAEDLTKVQVVLDWTPNTNHTGLYVAQQKGYFEDAGLEVEIILPGETGAEQLVATGKAQFGISSQESLTQARMQDVPLVSIAAIIQHNTSGFAAMNDVGLQSPKDLEGKTYGGWGSPVEQAVLQTFMEIDGADASSVNIVNAGNTDFFNMASQNIDFAWIYYGWTGIEAQQRGQEIDMLYLTDYAKELDYYTPVLITNEQYIEQEEQTIEAFMEAVTKGYELAIDEPTEAADALLAAVPELDKELVYGSATWLADKYQDDAAQWGEQSEDVWQTYADWMQQHGLIEHDFDAQQAFTNNFLVEDK